MDLNRIKQMLKWNAQVEFKNDPKIYYVKNISPDGVNVFVTHNGLQTYRKSLKNLIKVDGRMLQENDANPRTRIESKLKVFVYNFGGKENFEKVQAALKDNNVDFEKKVATFGTKGAANLVGLLVNSNLSKTAATAASQIYKNTVDVLQKEILSDIPQLKYREFRGLSENEITEGIKEIVREELYEKLLK
jgi:hypothetical protein